MSLKLAPAPGSGVSRKCLRGVRRDCDLRSLSASAGRPRAGAAAGLGARGPALNLPCSGAGAGAGGVGVGRGQGEEGVWGLEGLDRVARTADFLCLGFIFFVSGRAGKMALGCLVSPRYH